MKTKAYIIDPRERSINETLINGYNTISETLNDLSNSIRFPNLVDILYAADSGLYVPENKLFCFSHYHSPIAGKAVVAGFKYDEYGYGDFCDAETTLNELKKLITWPNYEISDLRFSFVAAND